jgi:predicted dienelactone hydrolase
MRRYTKCARHCLIAAAALSILLSGGCSTFEKPPQADLARVRQFAGRGYDSGIDYQISVTRSSPGSGDGSIQFTLIQPIPQGRYPLLIYLPGLGESDDDSAQLRAAWARSGYVVLSLQPLKRDADVWSSNAARSRDYTYLRHQMYRSASVSGRLDRLVRLAGYLKQQAASGGPIARRMDLSHIAIAGFDIGAYTAMIVAGEAPQHLRFAGLGLPAGGIIALSPYADFTGSDFEVRYRKIDLPVLSVTSDKDSDMRGSVPPSLHQAPFRYMPPGNKYLLLLAGASHAEIGNESLSRQATIRSDSGQDGSGGEADAESAAVPDTVATATRHAIREIALEQTTTAFLNACIKNDSYSLDWLKNDARRWLGSIGQLEQR